MRAWPSPQVPSLPQRFGTAPDLAVYDTPRGAVVRTEPRADGARLYVCGITPYDATHLGHAATYLAFDLLFRAWRDAGHEVTYVQNVTDVDDPLLERAQHNGEDWEDLAERETELFRADMAALRVLAPDHYLGVVESIELVIEQVERLRERGALYEVDGDLYFAVAADPAFGEICRLDRQTMLELFRERGGDPDRPGKKDPLDSLVWQRQRGDDPGWDSPFGRGRPGWHLECTAIALQHLGMRFDVQGGGNDLTFPHHEMCASQAQVATGEHPFAQTYVHAGMVGYGGEKMSKSKGNLVLVSALRDQGVDPMVLRVALLGHHYRADWEWQGDTDLRRAQERVDRWRTAIRRGTGPEPRRVVADVRAALSADLDAPRALEAVDSWADAALAAAGDQHGAAPGVVRDLLDARLGVIL